MKSNKYLSAIAAFVLAFSILNLSLPVRALSIDSAASPAVYRSDLEARLARIEEKFEKRRKELGIPGISVAIVKDGKVLLSKGYGYKDFEQEVPMTADTQLAIGSATKAFTALSVLMLGDEGKLSLDDKPSKHLPYFRINNPDTNEKIQIRDLLSHSSGLNRTDLAMITGKLNRQELIRVAGIAKPIAGLRENFYYQNIMFAAAGEIVAEVSGIPWEKFVPERIFAPLGMSNSTMSVKEMQKASDYSFGYSYNFDTKETRKLPARDLGPVGPAGSINSSSNDMAKWLNFVLGGGKPLISENSYDEWTKPQMKISKDGKASYGLGWFVQEWKGKKVIQHGGNIDGFNSMVAMLPEENLGFVLLTNVSASSLGGEMMQMVWSGILEDNNETKAGPEQEKEIGKYEFTQAGFDIDVTIEDGVFVAKVPGQPTYTLVKVEGRKYALSNAPAGFFITFKDDEAFLEQPQGNFTLKKRGTEKADEKSGGSFDEMIGVYQAKDNPVAKIEIKEIDGKVSLKVGSQPAYALQTKSKDSFALANLPATYYINAIRGKDGKISGMTMVQPEGEFEFIRLAKDGKEAVKDVGITATELIAKVVAAMGGEENLRKIKTRVTEFDLDAVHQGVKGKGKSYSKAPAMTYTETTLTALGKEIGWIKEYFDGENGGETYSFAPTDKFSGKRLNDVKFTNDITLFLDLEKKVETAEVAQKTEFQGQSVYVLVLSPKEASRVVYLISADTFLPVRASSVIVSSTSSQQIPVTTLYSDYREADGVMVPYKTVSNNSGTGEVVVTIRKIKHNKKIKDKLFSMP